MRSGSARCAQRQVVIDGMIDGEQLHGRFPQLKERMGEMGMLDVNAIADAF